MAISLKTAEVIMHESKLKEEVNVIFEELTLNHHFFDASVNGIGHSKLLQRSEPSGYDYLCAIEIFGIQVTLNSLPAFHIINLGLDRDPEIVTTSIGKSLINVFRCQNGRFGGIEISIYANAFFNAMKHLRRSDGYFFNEKDIVGRLDNKAVVNVDDALACNVFVSEYRKLLLADECRLKLLSRRNKANALNDSAVKYFDSLFSGRDGLVVVSIDFGERLDHLYSYTAANVACDLIRKNFRIFMKNCRQRSPTASMIGYFGKLDHSSIKGFFARVFFFFDSADFAVDQELCHEIGQYWAFKVASDFGTYHCSPISKGNKSTRTSVLLLRSSDVVGRRIFIERVIPYLTKSRIYFRHGHISEDESFFRGKIKQ